jgi:hypothetical protein
LISGNNASEDSKKTAGEPPSQRVTKEINLLLRIILSPEAHTSQQKWPHKRLAGVWVAASQSVVMVEHGSL